MIHQPHPKHKNLKRVTRLVILPDYQGIGLGYKFLTFIAKQYKNQKYDFCIVTSAKNLIMKLSKSNEWSMIRLSANRNSKTGRIDYYRKSIRSNCKTASFMYKGNN